MRNGQLGSDQHTGLLADLSHRPWRADINGHADEDAQTDFHAHGDLHPNTAGEPHTDRHSYTH